MKFLAKKTQAFFDDEGGAAALEYGLLAALIAAVIAVAVGAIGTNLNTVFENIRDRLVPSGGSGTGGGTAS
jgi:pilus assembly protein Flp/PilA